MVPPPAGLGERIEMASILLKNNLPTFSPRRKLSEPEAIIPFSGKFGSPKKPLYPQ